jgi:SAM-dependent methyltransferase
MAAPPLTTLIKKAIPVPWKVTIRRAAGRAGGVLRRSPLLCPVCEARVEAFVPLFTTLPTLHRELSEAGYELFDAGETLNSDAYTCPVCSASDRCRIYALWISDWLRNERPRGRVKLVDFAPTNSLSRFLRARFDYRSADLFSPAADDRVDLEDMAIYADGRFDAFICSHVLEHVRDDRKAMRELHRILAPGGWGIAMAPINTRATETDEETTPLSDGERLRRFGQADHLRFYSAADFKRRLSEAGFDVESIPASAIAGTAPARYGIHPRSVLYVVHKPV